MGIRENWPRLRRSGFLIGEIILYYTINFSTLQRSETPKY